MTAKTLTIASLVATMAFVASATLALAQPAVVTQDTKVRDYASNGAAVIDRVYDGQDVNVRKCSGSWCQIRFDGQRGWVKKNKLAFYDDEPSYPSYPSYPVHPRYPSYSQPSADFGVYSNQGSVSFGFNLSSY